MEMEYVVLARKLRPQRFQDLIGQETTVRALRNAVQSGRVAHAFLFAGSRGVGKTSAARILTKALNCTHPVEGEPCNECENCREITANASPDVFEIDAASNRGIDNIRELRENTRYAPAKCRFKTYIIDEVHMLTNESFNALLKTLEEPPPHIKFVLATTAPHRIPETVLSRCQRYDFARIPLKVMVEYLAGVAKAEALDLSPGALEAIARGSAGGMRDALTALDQVVSFAGTSPGEEQVLGMLGLMDNRAVLGLLAAILGKDLPAAMAAFEGLMERGADLNTLLTAMLTEIKELTLFQSLEGAGRYFQDHTPSAMEFFAAQRGRVGTEELQQLFYLLLELELQLKRSEFGRACFEMSLIKACRVAPLVGIPELLETVRRAKGGPPRGNPPPTASERRPPAMAQNRAREGGKTGAPSGTGAGGERLSSSREDGDPERAAQAIPPAPVAAPISSPAELPVESGADTSPPSPPPRELDSVAEATPETPPKPLQPKPKDPPSVADAFERFKRNAPPPVESPGPEAALNGGSAPEPTGMGAAPPSPPESGPPPGMAAPAPPPAPAMPEVEAPAPSVGEPETGAEAELGLAPPGNTPEQPPDLPVGLPPEEPAGEPPEVQVGPLPGVHSGLPLDEPAGEPPPPLDRPLPCEDPRWAAFIEAVKGIKPKAAADLRRAEVLSITDTEVEMVPPLGVELFEGPEGETLLELLQQAFGDAFLPRLNRDKNRETQPACSLVGRERQREEARLAAEREEAVADPAVQEVLRFFPEGRVKHVQPRTPDGREDV